VDGSGESRPHGLPSRRAHIEEGRLPGFGPEAPRSSRVPPAPISPLCFSQPPSRRPISATMDADVLVLAGVEPAPVVRQPQVQPQWLSARVGAEAPCAAAMRRARAGPALRTSASCVSSAASIRRCVTVKRKARGNASALRQQPGKQVVTAGEYNHFFSHRFLYTGAGSMRQREPDERQIFVPRSPRLRLGKPAGCSAQGRLRQTRGQRRRTLSSSQLADRLLELKRDLESGSYRPGPYVALLHPRTEAAQDQCRTVSRPGGAPRAVPVIEPRFERLFIPTATPTASARARIGPSTACSSSPSVIATCCAPTSSALSVDRPCDPARNAARHVPEDDIMALIDRILASGVGVLDEEYDHGVVPG
jgi:hypothetical protein